MSAPNGNPLATCPSCGHKLDGWTALGGGAQASEGCLSICLYCREVLRFRADLMLDRASDEEREWLHENHPKLFEILDELGGAR